MLGVVRDRLLATQVGVGPVLDIYNASFRFPDFLYAMMLAFVTAGTVVPFLTKENGNGAIVDPRHKLSSITLFFAGFIGVVSVVIGITLPLYAHAIVPGFSEEQVAQFIATTRIMLLQPFFLGLTSLISCFAQMRNEFVLYGISPLGYSAGIIFGILALYPTYGVYGLSLGVVIGAILGFIIQLFSLRHTKLHTVIGFFSKKHIEELFRLAIPRTGTNILTQLRVMFFTGFATTLGPGVLSSYLFAQRVTDAVSQIIQQSLTTASLPVLSREYTDNNIDRYKNSVSHYVVLLGGIGASLAVFLFMFREEVIWLLYGSTPYEALIAFFLLGFLIVLPFQMMNGYFSIAFYSARDTRSVFLSNLLGTALAVFACFMFRDLGSASLFVGVIIMALVNFIGLITLYARKKLA